MYKVSCVFSLLEIKLNKFHINLTCCVYIIKLSYETLGFSYCAVCSCLVIASYHHSGPIELIEIRYNENA